MILTIHFTSPASKHWSVEKQTKIWNWFTPNINKIFKQNIKTDTLPVWTSFLEVRVDTILARRRYLKDIISTCFTIGIPEGHSH